jgi:hypothetical protein
MSAVWIFAIGCFAFSLCIVFVVFSATAMRRLGREADVRLATQRASTPSSNAE